jgi:hypothetical protein
MAKKLPFLQLYVADYIQDTRVLTLETRAIWMDMLCLMHDSDRRGHLTSKSGTPFSIERIAAFCGCSPETVARAIQELLTSGVASCTNSNILFSRRMVSDERKRRKCIAAGKKGGNPTLKGQVKGRDKPPLVSSYGETSTQEEEEPFLEGGGGLGAGIPAGQPRQVRSNLRCDNADIDHLATAVLDHYQGVVQPANARGRAWEDVIALLNAGWTPDQLKTMADAYVTDCRVGNIQPEFRQGAKTFYAAGGSHRDYLDGRSRATRDAEERKRKAEEKSLAVRQAAAELKSKVLSPEQIRERLQRRLPQGEVT